MIELFRRMLEHLIHCHSIGRPIVDLSSWFIFQSMSELLRLMIGDPSFIAFRPRTGQLFHLCHANHDALIRSIELFRPMIGDPSSIAFRPGTGRLFHLYHANASIRSIELFRPMIGDPSSIAFRPGTGRLFHL
jgi:hypothetical protein